MRGTEYVDYCCSGTGLPAGCGEHDGLAGCVPGLVGWQCPITGTQHTLPKGQDLMSNKSRADQYYLLCSIPQVAPSGKVDTFCCYPPAAGPPRRLVRRGRLRLQLQPAHPVRLRLHRPRHAGGRLPANRLSEPGHAGTSMEGYPATLYCCNFVNDTH